MPQFLHVADPHIDSPVSTGFRPADLSGLRAESLTRDAFAAAVDLAITEGVTAFMIAGDLFDGDWKRGGTRQGRENAGTWQWTTGQFRRLVEAGIPVAFLRGNHDAASQLAVDLRFEGVHEFDTGRADTLRLPDAGLAIHGQGYERREQTARIAAAYPKADPGLFNVGVLHTGMESGGSYAPASAEDLRGRGYGYWALGHIHKPGDVGDGRSVPMRYAGNPQGRNVNECGPRGCLLVEYGSGSAEVEHRPLDKLRWFHEEVAADGCEDTDALLDAVCDGLAERRGSAGDRAIVARVTVTGSFEEHHKIDGFSAKSVFETDVRERAAELDNVWVEAVRVRTSPPVDVDRLVRPGDPMRDVLDQLDEALRLVEDDEAAADPLSEIGQSAAVADVTAAFDQHMTDIAARRLPFEPRAADYRRWLQAARSHLIAELAREA